MAWHVFEKLLEGVANYSTFLGKLWITFFFIFRIIMVASVGDTVYSDEQSQFLCNTLTPGCENVCFNKFSPISQIRFWAVQILFVGIPSVIFIVFAMHKMSSLARLEEEQEEKYHRGKRKDRRSEGRHGMRRREDSRNTSEKSVAGKLSSNQTSLPQYNDLKEKDKQMNGAVKGRDHSKKGSSYHGSESYLSNIGLQPQIVEIIEIENPPMPKPKRLEKSRVEKKTVYNKDGKSEVLKTPSITRAYFAQTAVTTLMEGLFLALQYHMYKFKVHEKYNCEGDPCRGPIECYVSRPMEKTLFLLFMYVMTSLSIFINVIEMLHLARKYLCSSDPLEHDGRSVRRRKLGRNGYMSGEAPGRVRRRTLRRVSAYPGLGNFPRSHSNSFSDSDGYSIDSDYRFN